MNAHTFIFLLLISCLSCNSDLSPIIQYEGEYDVVIEPTGKTDNGNIEFKFTNTSGSILKYIGYAEDSPFYMVQVKNDTGWTNSMGWCGTGAKSYSFYPGQSFKANVYKNADNNPWRVGLYTTSKTEQDGKYSWSAVQN